MARQRWRPSAPDVLPADSGCPGLPARHHGMPLRPATPGSRRRRLLLGAGAAASMSAAPWPLRAAGEELVVAQVASLSGPNGADLGQGLRSGIEACFREVNAAGGVNGRPLRLVSRDDRYVPGETVRLTRQAIEQDKPVALIGYRGTANTLALVESGLLPARRITLVGTLTGARELQGAPGVLHLRTSYERELSELILQIRRLTLDRIAVLHAGDAFGRTGLAAVRQAAAASSTAIESEVAYDKAPDKAAGSVAAAARDIAATAAKAVVLVAVGEPVYSFIRAFRPLARSVQIFCMSVVEPAAVVQRCGEALAAGIGFSQVFPFPHSEKVALVRAYRAALRQLPEAPAPGYFSLEGYVYARVLASVLNRTSEPVSQARVSAAADALTPLDLGGLRVQIDPLSRNGMRYTDLTILDREGRLVS